MLVKELQKEYQSATENINECLLDFTRDYELWDKIEDQFKKRLLQEASKGKDKYIVNLKPLDQLDVQNNNFLEQYSACSFDFSIEHADANLEELYKIEANKMEKNGYLVNVISFDECYQGIFFRIAKTDDNQYNVQLFVSPNVLADYAQKQGLFVEKSENKMIFDWSE